MGDLIGDALEGTLRYVPAEEFDRVRALSSSDPVKAAVFANLCRLNVLYMIARAGSGHIGSSFSSLDILSWLLLKEVRAGESNAQDVFFSSKGHDAPAYYSVLIALGRLPFERLHGLRRITGLPGHPDVGTPWIEANTGSLGMGISKAKGMAFAHRRDGKDARVFVLTGDGELQEGQIWESLISAANNKTSEILAIVDHNKLQSDTLVSKTSDLGDLDAKFAAFGWHVERVNGHDIGAVAAAIARCREVADRPQVIIADTVKGRGVSFMEHTAIDSDVELYKYHSGAPGAEAYGKAVLELTASVDAALAGLGVPGVRLESVERPQRAAPAVEPQRMVAAYSQALLAEARADQRIIALNADLVLDTGLLPFKAEFPDRFVECGIAEMDMVSQAGGMALKGLVPVVHSFACFLSARPNEQIYNNATEHTKVLYVGSLAGIIPGGPGHSHQAVRDIAALSGVPNMILAEPSCEAEVAPLLKLFLHEHNGPSYLRLVSVPWPVEHAPPAGYRPSVGRGWTALDGSGAVIVTSGPIMTGQALAAARSLAGKGIALKVVVLPWLNRVDPAWLGEVTKGARVLFTLDNHYVEGGQGQFVATAAAEAGLGIRTVRLGLDGIPASGTNDEVLEHHRLDVASIAARIAAELG